MSEFAQRQNRTQNNHLISPAKPGRVMRQPVHAENPPLAGQQALGNQAVQRLLRSGVIQAKLTINEPGDQYEQEADQVADAVMRMPDPVATKRAAVSGQARSVQIQRMCPECEEELHRQPMEEVEGAVLGQIRTPRIQRVCSECEEDLLQTKRAPGRTPEATPQIQAQVDALRGGGQPLPQSVRAFFEPRFGRDFSQVRVHTDARAAESARSVNALAYTMGSDVVFGEGQYRPGTEGGRKLLAHELAHTIQQAGAPAPEIQRKIGDGHDLTSPRLAGDRVLEAVYDNERVLKPGDKGAAVRKLQLGLMDAGSLEYRFVNGNFDSKTTAAVMDFQRASGLGGVTGKGIDGIVDATTIGWLDQLLSEGPTPPGKTPGATPGCREIKTVNVDLVSLDGSSRYMFGELRRATAIFNQCCVRFAITGGGYEDAARTQALLGGDNVLHINPRVGDPTAEEIGMFKGATADFNLSGRIRAFFVHSVTPSSTPFGDIDAYSVPPVTATGSRAALRNMVVITNAASERALAHEFGHVLLDQGSSAHQDMDPEYLMSPAGPTPGERLTPTQCGTIFANA